MIAMLEVLVKLPQPLQWPAELAAAVTVCLGAAWVAVRCCHKRSAAMRSHLWLLGFAAAAIWIGGRMAGATYSVAILPAVTAPTPPAAPRSALEPEKPATNPVAPASRQAPVRLPEPDTAPPATTQEVPSTSTPSFFARLDWAQWAARVWGLGAAFLLLRIFASVGIVSSLLRSARPIAPGSVLAEEAASLISADSTKLHVMLHAQITSPVSVGSAHGWVLLPDAAVHWDATRVRLVLAHELAHCRRRDYLAVLFLRLFAAVCWFHPLTWLGLRRFRALCENAADDRALEYVEATAYAEELLCIVRELRPSPPLLAAATLSIGEPTTLRERIVAMLDANRERGRLSLRVSLVTTLVAGVAAILVSGLRLVHAENATPAAGEKATAVKAADHARTREITVGVIDETGKPVAGAEIKPDGCRTALDAGSWYNWNPLVPIETAKTDATGQAVVRVPVYAVEDQPTSGITATVEHPEYCLLRAEISLSKPARLILKRGMLVTLRSEAPVEPGSRVCADLALLNGGYATVIWKPRADAQGVTGRVPEGDYAIQAVAVDREGRPQFSEWKRLNARPSQDAEFILPVQPGIVRRGKLAADVPLPVTNGHVAGRVISVLGGEEQDKVSWEVWAPVQPDGTFEIKDAPPGRIELLATCDGFVSRNPDGDRKGRYGSVVPQSFRKEEEIVIAMEKTGAVRVTALAPDGKPLSDVEVGFWPNQMFGLGSSVLGRHYDQGRALVWMQYEEKRGPNPNQMPTGWSVRTDEKGQATVPNLPPGSQAFSIIAPGYKMPILITDFGVARREGLIDIKRSETVSLTIKMESDGQTSLAQRGEREAEKRGAKPGGNLAEEPVIEIRQNRLTGDSISVTPGKDLVGQVVDESGAPLAGVLVDAWTWEPGNETVTDLEGRFRLVDPKGEEGKGIEVQFSLAGFSPVHITRQPIGKLSQDVKLSTRPYFEGVVTDSQGKPLANQLIRATAGEKETEISSNDYWCETHTDDQGHYRFHVFPDTYRLEVRSKTGEVARIAEQTIRRDETRKLDIQLRPGLIFRALVVDAGTGVPVAGVRFSHWQHPGVEGVSDEVGNVAIAGMFPGNFRFDVEAEKQGYRRWWSAAAVNDWERRKIEDSGWQRNFDYLEFTLAAGDQSVRIEMEKGVTVRGVVRNPDGKPVAKATVAAAHTGTGNSLTGDTRFSVRTGEEGRFEMLLPAGNGVPYNLVAHDGGYKQWRGLANGVFPPMETRPGQVIENVEISLNVPCVVRGRVVDAAGKAVGGREVRAASSDGWENRYYSPTTRTQPDGSFELGYVRSGKNLIQVAPFWLDPREAPAGTSVEVLAAVERPATDVVLTAKAAK